MSLLVALVENLRPFWLVCVNMSTTHLFIKYLSHILAYSGAWNCTFLEFWGSRKHNSLFGVRSGLKLTLYGWFWHQKIHLFGFFRTLIYCSTFLEFLGAGKLQKGAFSGARKSQNGFPKNSKNIHYQGPENAKMC